MKETTVERFLELHFVNVPRPIFVEEQLIILVDINHSRKNAIVKLPDDKKPKFYRGIDRVVMTVCTRGGFYQGEIVKEKVQYVTDWYNNKSPKYWEEVNARAFYWEQCAADDAKELLNAIENAKDMEEK